MTITDEMRLAVADMFKFAHRKSCYPDAMQFEAEMFADGVLSAIAPAIRKAALEEAAEIARLYPHRYANTAGTRPATCTVMTASAICADIRTLADKEET